MNYFLNMPRQKKPRNRIVHPYIRLLPSERRVGTQNSKNTNVGQTGFHCPGEMKSIRKKITDLSKTIQQAGKLFKNVRAALDGFIEEYEAIIAAKLLLLLHGDQSSTEFNLTALNAKIAVFKTVCACYVRWNYLMRKEYSQLICKYTLICRKNHDPKFNYSAYKDIIKKKREQQIRAVEQIKF